MQILSIHTICHPKPRTSILTSPCHSGIFRIPYGFLLPPPHHPRHTSAVHTADKLLAFSRANGEPPSFAERRRNAWREMQSLLEGKQTAQPVGLAGTVVKKNIVIDHDASRGKGMVAVTLRAFSSIDAHARSRLEEAFGSLLPALGDLALLRHYAFLTDAVFIFVPDAYACSSPIRLTITADQPGTATHVVVLAGTNAKVSVVEMLEGDSADCSHAVELIGAEGAHLEYVSLNRGGAKASMRLWQRSRVFADATVTWRNATLSGGEVEHALQSCVAGAGGTSQIDWLFYARGRERQRLDVRNIFDSRDGGGEIAMRGVAEEQGHVGCNGMIAIGLQGGGTNTFLTQEVLMLDRTSKVDAIPGLEIKTNDVKASHSATVSRVTEEDLFYFASRGIDSLEARRMFVLGFAGSLTERISDAAAREAVLTAIEEKYGRGREASGKR